MPNHLIRPHGGKLVQLLASEDRRQELRRDSVDWPSWDLTERQLFDLELILNGGFSPLRGFVGRRDYESVCDWPTARCGRFPSPSTSPSGSPAVSSPARSWRCATLKA